MPNILVTGANGQLGSEIEELSSKYDNNFFFTDANTLNITDKDALQHYVTKNKIDTIINCAAYTAVDKAEEAEELADKINHIAVQYLAKIAKEKEIKLIHISTDYVFDGKHYKPYNEEDSTHPSSIYGKTKLAGEKALLEIGPKNSIIIRTSWVYSSFGANFVKTMLKYGKERDELRVVYDQVGTPTYARDLAQVILEMIPQLENESPEVYHYTNEGVLSWYDFAKEIMKMAKIECQITPIETYEYPLPAPRPHYSLLNKAKIKKEYNLTIPFWKDSLQACLIKMGEKKK